MSSRNMCLLTRATLHSDSEQYISAKTKLKKSHRINILMIYRLQKYRIQYSTSTFRSLDLFLSFTYKFLTYVYKILQDSNVHVKAAHLSSRDRTLYYC
jgi:hypothetical protein